MEGDRHEECPGCMDETMGSSFVEEGVTYWSFYCDRCDHVWIPEEEEVMDKIEIWVLEDGETYTTEEPIKVTVTKESMQRIEGGEKVYNVVPEWVEGGE